jgi:hypothetical protein
MSEVSEIPLEMRETQRKPIIFKAAQDKVLNRAIQPSLF